MAKHLATQLLQQWNEALKTMPPGFRTAGKILVWEELASNKVLITIALAWVLLFVARTCLRNKKRLPPAIPGGLPVLGNLLQLTEKKPHRTFTAWSKEHGPIFTIKVGSVPQAVVNNSEIAKEVLVTKFASISKRQMPMALRVLTRDKTMVAMSDYGEEHRMLKKLVMTNLLGPTTQNKNRSLRDDALIGMIEGVLAELKASPTSPKVVNVRDYVQRSLFPFALQQVFGYIPDQVEVLELGTCVSTWDMFDALVVAPLSAVINVDWRDFFPALRWIPNRSVEDLVRTVDFKRNSIMKALIRAQRMRLANLKEPPRCYADIALTEATHLTEKQLEMSLWEPIIESADTTLVTSEWAMYEIAKNPDCQDRLYREIVSVAGTERMVTEDDLPNMPYLGAIIKETLRKYTPVPLIPSRFVEEDITLGGYDIPKGYQILVNLFAIANDPAVWSNPEKWDPERMLANKKVDMGFRDFSLMPFGAGKRMCAGITQAMFIIPMNVAALVQHCEWRLSPQEISNINNKIEDVVYLTTHKLSPLSCEATPRISHRLP
ncbi:ent-kaurene oxidase [Physcomitrium patens]|uniref:Ent-kaurene oxidase n=1 Tax=Physcomitrium patens TaxID=3218 RepID=F2ZAE0_PHYPA|nr:ent-kaurene oxidase-like 3 [Physcomitrium patens]XP_024357340.1 ent-kaurene oxidase-like 3 [Physcomitrium patens]XP_024357341.1 ent-kaurene oxidase-like 3 [Physcomitrium patens]XP_024357343.1 ent-kaurene oxidase-like 3 [Physcomitrium patens]XP_024357344.1 ent-kaurene oxidase-like 3 [Physcomitrium patens]XP_024357345.1 ent-kaurene oxidase-like 3 [Physcomitrium patens]PNR32569.1 hypothetical protein PHYPA_024511 [Physcomitrium patens]PNR32570.1 hypothetical protein PHYPA_024512 [Physcomitri|eukprot:XP_024357339.1 ent-kaurene oxidase-like 3 [Physcomitrella patens]